jgi:hypothetical protein
MNQRIRVTLPLAACALLAMALSAPTAFAAEEGLRVVRDAATGQLRAPTAAEAQALQAQRRAAPRGLLTGKVSPTPRRLANGAVAMELTTDQLMYSVATRNADGSIAQHCVPNAQMAERMAAGQTVSFAPKISERRYEEQ